MHIGTKDKQKANHIISLQEAYLSCRNVETFGALASELDGTHNF